MTNHPKTYDDLLKELENLRLENELLKTQHERDIANFDIIGQKKAEDISPSTEEQKKLVVLLVEDDFINQITIKKFIEKMYSVIITDSSDEAIKIINKQKIDIILMDISIKGKKNGLELTRELKDSEDFSHIPIIIVTAYAFDEDKQNTLISGCDGCLIKPFTKEELLEMIDQYSYK